MMTNKKRVYKWIFIVLGLIILLAIFYVVRRESSLQYKIPYKHLLLQSKKYGLDTSVCFYVDYTIPSGRRRFFICDLLNNTILYSDYCMHGPGKGSTVERPVFSNEKGSNCSSLGAFRVCRNQWGYRLKEKRSRKIVGLERRNDQAETRGLMIHDSRFLDSIVMLQPILKKKYLPLNASSSSGCVTITTKGFSKVRGLVKAKDKDILLYTDYPTNGPK